MKSSHAVVIVHAAGGYSAFAKRIGLGLLFLTSTLSLTNCASSQRRAEEQPRAEAATPVQTPQQQAAARLQGEKEHFVADTQRRID